jgi:hypothetical protein
METKTEIIKLYERDEKTAVIVCAYSINKMTTVNSYSRQKVNYTACKKFCATAVTNYFKEKRHINIRNGKIIECLD